MPFSFNLRNNLIDIELPKSTLSHLTIGNIKTWYQGTQGSQVSLAVKKGKIVCPTTFDFRKGNYFLKDGVWYYHRNFKGFKSIFSYDDQKSTLVFSSWMHYYLPFILNSLYPIGYELSNIIYYKLYEQGYLALRGSAFILNGKTVLFLAPSFNGKTTLIKDLSLRDDFTYIAEDVFFVKNNEIYGVPPDFHNYGREVNANLRNSVSNVKSKTTGIDFIVNYSVSQRESVVSAQVEPETIFENYLYMGKSMGSAMAYYAGFDPAMLVELAKKYFNNVPAFKMTTDGYDTKKVISLLYELQ